MLTLWERIARSVYSMFSVPRQEKIRIKSLNKGDRFIIADSIIAYM